MKFLHTSDWHLGAMEGDTSLYDDQRFFIEEICRIITEQKVDAVVIAGDIYDRSVASASAIGLYDWAMTRICQELAVPVITVAGNHDSAERLSSCSGLLEKAGLYVVGAAERDPKIVSFSDTEFFLLPWITEEKVKSLFPEKKKEINDITDAYEVCLSNMRNHFTSGKKHIAVAHAFIADSETSTSDRAAEIGYASQVPASVFSGFDYVALGHIHKPQDVTEKIRYSGTPMTYSFGKEEKQQKSVTIVDTGTMEHMAVPIKLLHKRTTLEGTFDEIIEPSCSDEERNGYVRIAVTDTAIGLELLSKIKEIYPYPLVVSGKSYDGENESITLTLEELEKMENDPIEVFKSFCREAIKEEADPHFVELFEQAMQKTMEECE